MKGLLPKHAGLLAFFVCGASLLPRADSATLSISVSSSVQTIGEYGPYEGEIDQCSISRWFDGPSLSPSVACYSMLGHSSSAAEFVGELTDVYGQAEYWVGAYGSDPGCCGHPYPYEDPLAELAFDFIAGGSLYITAPSPAVDITFAALNGSLLPGYWLSVNGIWSDSNTFQGIPTHTPIPYFLEVFDFMWNVRAPDSFWWDPQFSYDLRSVSIRDHASGEILAGAEITFGAAPVPEPGAAVLCAMGITLIAASKCVGNKRTRRRLR